MPSRDDTIAVPPRRILVATDFSLASAAARDYALALAAPAAEVTFLNCTVLPIPEAAPPPEWMPDEPSARTEPLSSLEEFSEPARDRGCTVHLVLEEGLPAETILTAARAMSADLVVLGTHGRRGFERWVQGSTAQRVLRQCPAPVLTVSSVAGRATRLQRILCAVGTTDSVTTIGFAHRLAKSCGATLTCLHVVEPPVSSAHSLPVDLKAYYVAEELRCRGRISAALRAVGADAADLVIRAGQAKGEILHVAASAGADLLVMGARGTHPGEAGFGSTVESIGRDAICPVLTLRHPIARASAPQNSREELSAIR